MMNIRLALLSVMVACITCVSQPEDICQARTVYDEIYDNHVGKDFEETLNYAVEQLLITPCLENKSFSKKHSTLETVQEILLKPDLTFYEQLKLIQGIQWLEESIEPNKPLEKTNFFLELLNALAYQKLQSYPYAQEALYLAGQEARKDRNAACAQPKNVDVTISTIKQWAKS